MNSDFSAAYKEYKEEIFSLLTQFDKKGKVAYGGKRNTIKLFDLNGLLINVKAFKTPNLVNQVAYKFFRKSKARRSFEYARKLKSLDIGTPEPIGYVEYGNTLLFKKSFYVSEHLAHDFTFRELVHEPNFPNRHEILKQFTAFTYKLHENGIEFLDHSPGNTLIIFNEKSIYDFYLVDLNRMKFHNTLDYDTRIKNFAKLTPEKSMISVISGVYAKLIGKDYHKVYNDMWEETQKFQEKFHRKKRVKKQLKFWKK